MTRHQSTTGHALDAAPGTGAFGDPADATAVDVAAFRRDFYLALPDVPDTTLLEAMNAAPALLAGSREWGWSDTEIRDGFAAHLEGCGIRLD